MWQTMQDGEICSVSGCGRRQSRVCGECQRPLCGECWCVHEVEAARRAREAQASRHEASER